MELPLFPLPNVVLFPNIALPLHIFEDRYKLMINECVEAGDVFGLVLLREGAQEETEQTIHRVGTTARVVEVERLDGGRMNILCQGEMRFRVNRFTGRHPYWKGSVELFDDESSDENRIRLLHNEVSSLYTKAFELGVQLGVVSRSELRLPQSSRELSFMISYILDIASESKQKLLEVQSTEDRLSDLMTHLEDIIQRLEQQVAQKAIVKKVRGNGDLGKPGTP